MSMDFCTSERIFSNELGGFTEGHEWDRPNNDVVVPRLKAQRHAVHA